MWVFIVMTCGVAALLAPSLADAQSASPQRVVVSPLAYTPHEFAAEGRDAVVEGAADYLDSSSLELDVVSPQELQRIIADVPTYGANVQVARDWSELGVAKYRQLDSVGAIGDLKQAHESYTKVGHDFVAPAAVAEVLLFLSLALLEQGGDVAGPLEAMKELIALDPTTELLPGAYPDEVVQFYEGARISLETDLRDRGPDPATIARLADLSEARWVVAPAVVSGGDDAVSVVTWLYDAQSRQFLPPETLEVPSPTPQRLRDAANRGTSRLITCLAEPDAEVVDDTRTPGSRGASPFALQFSGTYGSFFEFPQVSERDTVDPFAQLGAALGASVFLTREFAVLAMFQFLNAQKDHDGQIESGFNTLRWFVGAELGFGLGRFRFSVAPLFELMLIGEIRYCSTFDEDLSRCVPRNRDPNDYEPLGNSRVVLGVNARPRVTYQIVPSLGAFVAGSSSFFFAQDDRVDPNYLTTLEAGLQYRF